MLWSDCDGDGRTYEPSSHSGSTKLPPPLTPGSHDFFGATAAAMINLRGETELPALAPAPAENKAWLRRLLLAPLKKDEPKPLRTAAEVAAIFAEFDYKEKQRVFI